MPNRGKVAVIIVSFRNPPDVCACLRGLEKCSETAPFDIFIAENGGPAAYSSLLESFRKIGHNPSEIADSEINAGTPFNQIDHFTLSNDSINVYVGESKDNFGYGGGINTWAGRLSKSDQWRGFWILNPDAIPDPDALVEMVTYAEANNKGMVGGRLVSEANPEIILTRGLQWSFWQSRTIGIDKFTPSSFRPDAIDIERRMDAPSGASFYISLDCIRRIGLMDERYFLYFEDLDWGLRAKTDSGLGYAFDSIVAHIGGTTIGSASSRRERSRLAVYLDFRNRLLFVRNVYPAWLPWTIVMVLARTFEFPVVGAFANFRAALAGWFAGIRGETGRPDHLMKFAAS